MKKLTFLLFLGLALYSAGAREPFDVSRYFEILGNINENTHESANIPFSNDLAYEVNHFILNEYIFIYITKEHEENIAQWALSLAYAIALGIKESGEIENFNVLFVENGNLSMLVTGIDSDGKTFYAIHNVFRAIP